MNTSLEPRSGWTGWIIFASVFMIIIGVWNAIEGLVAILKKTVYVSQGAHLIVTTNYNAWGWTLLIWGIVVFLAGLGLFAGQTWGGQPRPCWGPQTAHLVGGISPVGPPREGSGISLSPL